MSAFLKSPIWKYLLICLAVVLIFLAVFPVFFKEKLKIELEKALQQQVAAELRFDEVHLTFFRHFPSLTLSVDRVYLGGSEPFASDTLLYADELGFGVGLTSLFSDRVKVHEIYLDQANVKIMRDIRGNSNFDVFSTTTADSTSSDTSSFELDIESFSFKNSRFLYEDTSMDLVCEAKGLDYQGSGNLLDAQVNLESSLQIGEFRLVYGTLPIFNRNRLAADLLTRINTETTALTFERNALKINDLPLNFVGAFEFIPGGYDMNFILESFDADLKDMLSLVPPEFMPGFEQTRFGGKGDIVGSFQGQYLPEKNQFPGLAFNLRLVDGLIARSKTSPGIEHLTARVNLRIPQLDLNQVIFDLDSLCFTLGEGLVKGALHLEGLNPMKLDSDLEAKLDLAQLQVALGTEGIDYRGQLELLLHSRGNYRFAADPTKLRDPKPIVQSIPAFDFSATLQNGYLHWKDLPEPIRDLQLQLKADSPDSLSSHINLALEKLHFQVLDQVTDGFFKYLGRENNRIDANLQSNLDLAEIPKFYPLDSGYQLAGKLHLDLVAEGNYIPEQKITPVTKANISLQNAQILTPYSPEAIQDISCALSLLNTSNTFEGLEFEIHPLKFHFAGSPFALEASLKNLDDIQYDVQVDGRLELGKLARVFGVTQAEIEGQLLADLSLKGTQSAAAAGKINLLDNRGTLQMEKIQVRTDLLPEPLGLDKGSLSFDQDKIEFSDFLFSYSKNHLTASGHLSNYLGYLVDPTEMLSGDIQLTTAFVDLEDFLFFGKEDPVKVDTLGVVTGVIVPPSNLTLSLTVSADSIRFDNYSLSAFTGKLSTSPREIRLEQTTFQLVGAKVAMNGAYRASTPFAAEFDYEIKASEFDIQRAYQEIPIFREMVSFAEFAEGQASLSYRLTGKLNAEMYPILPSITGGGTLGLTDIKLKGFKLMNTIAQKTENEELTDPQLSDIEIKTTIANNLITIPRTRMRIVGFRPRLEGQVSLDGDLNIGLRLGLPPLGIFGIPVKITGNAENYDMKVGKTTKEDNLAAEFEEEAPSPTPTITFQND